MYFDPTYILVIIGAIISMIVVIFVLPSMLMVFDRVICATTGEMRKIKKQKVAATAAGV